MTDELKSRALRIVVLGDLHGHWDGVDEEYYRSLACDLVLFTGDLADSIRKQRKVAASLGGCGRHVFGLLGNHDGASHLLASAEAHGHRFLEQLLSSGHPRRVRQLHEILGEKDIGLERRELPELDLTLIGGCPLQSGGPRFGFARSVHRVYGSRDPEERLKEQVFATRSSRLIILAQR